MASRARKRASIVIPCWNNVEQTKDCLEALRRCTAEPYELLLVDNGSTDGTSALLRRWQSEPGVRVIRNKANLGFGRAINQGMKQASGDYIVWLNNDTLVTPGWLGRLIACAERHPNVGAVGPLVNNGFFGQKPQKPVGIDRTAAALALRSAGQATRVPWLIGFCFLLKRAAFEQVGLLDRRFGAAYLEDYDYSLRLRQAGYELMIAQDAYVFHRWRQSFVDDAAADRVFKANRKVFIEKWCRRSMEFLLSLPPLQYDDAALWKKAPAIVAGVGR